MLLLWEEVQTSPTSSKAIMAPDGLKARPLSANLGPLMCRHVRFTSDQMVSLIWKSATSRMCCPSGLQRGHWTPAGPSSILHIHSGSLMLQICSRGVAGPSHL